MPINFVTGLPRHGKTLWTITTVKERADKEQRQVYYCNIPGVTIEGWKQIEHPDEWLQLPDKAIIIIDELQDFWGKAASGQKVPEPILQLSKHGKRGFDFYFITQEPNLVHSTPRDLCEHHYYVVRAFGTHNAMVHKFDRLQLHPDKARNKNNSMPWRYPKEAFGWYKSADVHNIKRRIPWKVWALPIFVCIAAGMMYTSWQMLKGTLGRASGEKSFLSGSPGGQVAKGLAQPGQAPAGAPGGQGAPARVMTTAEYVAQYQPRIPDLPHTAPAYDGVTAPTEAPYPAACVASATRCKCYTQQATHLRISEQLCRDIAAGGFFMAWQRPQQAQQAPVPTQAVKHVAEGPQTAPGPQISVIGNTWNAERIANSFSGQQAAAKAQPAPAEPSHANPGAIRAAEAARAPS